MCPFSLFPMKRLWGISAPHSVLSQPTRTTRQIQKHLSCLASTKTGLANARDCKQKKKKMKKCELMRIKDEVLQLKCFFFTTLKGQTLQSVETNSVTKLKMWLKCRCSSRTWRWIESPEGNCQHSWQSKEKTPSSRWKKAKTIQFSNETGPIKWISIFNKFSLVLYFQQLTRLVWSKCSQREREGQHI